ncbi:5966_t:CDS:2 [Funneliformis mosseae]|uniref:5966_t:CDS:1 n=1 Tax=Funneliformis mosseae TaxID=27381 RepID=A0A9N9EEF4_FUNMO|nr:5966_t:CDS:2 [Funneliformis mosseae]
MSTFSATTISKHNDEEKIINFCLQEGRRYLRYPNFEVLRKEWFSFQPPEALNPTTNVISNPPETVESLRKYKKRSGQAQKFLDRVGQNFRAQPYLLLDNIDKGTFYEKKDDWVLVFIQEVKKYGSEYTSKELVDLEEKMPGAIYLPVDNLRHNNATKPPPERTVPAHRATQEHMIRVKVRRLGTTKTVTLELNFNDPAEGGKLYKTVIASGTQERTLPYHVRRVLGRTGWQIRKIQANGYGYPAYVYYATTAFEIAIGDNNGWSKWVNTNTLRVWQSEPGDHIERSLVGTDVLDQFSFVHEPNQGFKFLSAADEVTFNQLFG